MKNSKADNKKKDRFIPGIIFGVICLIGAVILSVGYVYTLADTVSNIPKMLLNISRMLLWLCIALFTLVCAVKKGRANESKAFLWALIIACALRIILSLIFIISQRSDFYGITTSYSAFDMLLQISTCILYAALAISVYCILKGIYKTAKWASILTLIMIFVNIICYSAAYADALSYYYYYLTDAFTDAIPVAIGNSFVELFAGISLLIYCIKYDKKQSVQ